MLQRKSKPFFILAALFLSSGVSCQLTQPLGQKTTGDVLIIPEHQKPALINPIRTSTTFSARLSEIIFDGLIRLDEQFEPKPHLAKSWEQSKDGMTWTFNLRSGVKFHDGVEFTSEDAVFTFKKMKEFPRGMPYAFISQDVDVISVKDKYTLQFILKKPLASFIHTLFVGILPRHLLEGKDLTATSSNLRPVGTGPFKLKSWSDQGIILEAHKDYFLGRTYLDQIRVIVYPNREAAWAKMMMGEADFFNLLTPGNYDVLKQVPAINFYSAPMPFYYLIAFNLKKGIFGNQKTRQALNYSISKEKIVTMVLKDQGQVAAGTIFPNSWASNPRIKPYPYNPKKALALLKEAGWEDHDGDHFLDKDGKPFEFTVDVNAGDGIKQKTLLLIQEQLLDIGIKMDVKLFDAANIDFLFKKEFQAFFPEIAARGDPDFSYKHWHASQIEGGVNVSSYHNSEVDRLLEEGRTEFDQERRKAIYFKFQEELLKDPPGIFLFWTNYLVGVHKRFKGVQISPVGPFANILEWYVPKAEQRYAGSGSVNE